MEHVSHDATQLICTEPQEHGVDGPSGPAGFQAVIFHILFLTWRVEKDNMEGGCWLESSEVKGVDEVRDVRSQEERLAFFKDSGVTRGTGVGKGWMTGQTC